MVNGMATRRLWPAASAARCSIVLATDLCTYSQLSPPNLQNLRRVQFADLDWLPAHTRAPPRPFSRQCVHSRSIQVHDIHASPDVESPGLFLQEDSWPRLTESHIYLDTNDST